MQALGASGEELRARTGNPPEGIFYHRRPNLRMNDQVLRVFNGFYKQIYSQPKLF